MIWILSLVVFRKAFFCLGMASCKSFVTEWAEEKGSILGNCSADSQNKSYFNTEMEALSVTDAESSCIDSVDI